MCISRAIVSAVSCLVVPAFICIDLLISLVLKINDDDDDDDLVPWVHLTLNCCSFLTSAHASVPAAPPLLLQLFGTPFLWPFVVVSPLTVFGANSKLSSITLLSGLLNAPPHPAPQIRRISRRHCALYKYTYLLTYLVITHWMCCSITYEIRISRRFSLIGALIDNHHHHYYCQHHQQTKQPSLLWQCREK